VRENVEKLELENNLSLVKTSKGFVIKGARWSFPGDQNVPLFTVFKLEKKKEK
jgi:hypothetical protein